MRNKQWMAPSPPTAINLWLDQIIWHDNRYIKNSFLTGWGHFYENIKTWLVLLIFNYRPAGLHQLQVLDFRLNNTRHD